MTLDFTGVVFEWRGPAPFYFVRVPDEEADAIKSVASMVTYGWGVIPATITIGDTSFETSLFPKDGGYLVPLKADVRKAEAIADDAELEISLHLAV